MSYKVNKAIEVTYQAAGAVTGLADVTMVIYDELHALDGVNFPDVILTEIGATGRYYGSFTPDVEGEWNVLIDSVATPGKVVRNFEVVAHDVDSVGDDVAALNDITTVQVNAEVDTALADYDVAKASDIVSPPMLG